MRDKYGQILDAIKGARINMLALAFLVYSVAILIASYRLKLIVDAQESLKVTFSEAVSLTFIGYFFNNFLPTAIGGDVAKGYYLSRKAHDKLNSYAAVFIDRAIGLVTMVFMAAAALLFFRSDLIDVNIRILIYAITAASLAIILIAINKGVARRFAGLLAFVKPFEEKLKRLYNIVHVYKHRTRLIIQTLAISVVSQLLFFISIGIMALSIGAKISFLEILLRMPIISAVSLLPSINGLGVREGSTVVFFGPIIGKTNAFAVSILWLLVLFATSLVGGLIYALSPQFKIKWGEIKEKDAI